MGAVLIPMACFGCAETSEPDPDAPPPSYLGIETRLLDESLVEISVSLKGARSIDDVTTYADCGVAQYTLIRDFGFARHLRTNTQEKGGVTRADAVYTISKSLPDGLSTIDAKTTVADCLSAGIPTV